jgi:methyltransferase (TIGR00027 family)
MSPVSERQTNIGNRPSRTAMFAAIHRYLSLFESNPDFSSRDYLSGQFIPAYIRLTLCLRWLRRHVRKKLNIKAPGTYQYVIARTRFFDEQFLKALEGSVPQIVILGAGYDTRAVRYRERLGSTKVFELDTPALQHRKSKIYKQNKVSIPDNPVFCPITFGQQSIAEVLEKHGYDSAQRTLFLWEGVTYYLTESAVLETLGFIKNNAGPASELVFDYFYKSFVGGGFDYYGAKPLYDAVVKIGEPFLFGIEEDGLSQFISDAGFELITHLTPETLEEHYLSSENGSLGKVYGFAECVHARLKC